MASYLNKSILWVLLLHFLFFLSHHMVHSNDVEDNLLQGLNSYRTSNKLTPFAKNKNADCLAEKVADEIEDNPCTPTNIVPNSMTQLSTYPKPLSKCNIDSNAKLDGVVLPVCVRKLVPTLVLTNYTHTQFGKYLNDSKYSGVGVDSEKDWMVVVLSVSTSTPLSTGTPAANFANGANVFYKGFTSLGFTFFAFCVCVYVTFV